MLEYLLALLNVFGSGILSINYFTKILIIYKTVIKQRKTLKNFQVIQLPPKGSDLNPIEYIWGEISR